MSIVMKARSASAMIAAIVFVASLPASAQTPAREKPNGGRAETAFGNAGEIAGAAAAGAAGMRSGLGGGGAAAAAAAASQAGRAVGEAAGRAVDSHADNLQRNGYRVDQDPRGDPRNLFGE